MEYIKRFWPLYLVVAVVFVAVSLGTDRVVTTIAENSPLPRNHILVIDAGHGGEDGGAVSCTGVAESTINLQIALRLEDLCHLLGWKTVMIRTTDISVYTEGGSLAAKKASDLRQRVRIVNQTENGILISIHQNTYADPRYFGPQVFYGATEGSKDLAEQMQGCLNFATQRQSKAATGVYLMQHIETVGVLVECGFISNENEESMLRTADYQKKLCCAMASAVSQYINT